MGLLDILADRADAPDGELSVGDISRVVHAASVAWFGSKLYLPSKLLQLQLKKVGGTTNLNEATVDVKNHVMYIFLSQIDGGRNKG